MDELLNPAVEEPCDTKVPVYFNNEPKTDATINEEDLKKEVIRQAMSELGKRSAAARKRTREHKL